MAEKFNDQILQTRSIPAKPISRPQDKPSREYTDEDADAMGKSQVDQTIAAETQTGENADITSAKEHHHHHHHHHHKHSLFHSSIRSLSDLFDFISRLCKKPYTLAYVIVFVMFIFSSIIATPKCLSFVRAFRSLLAPESFYRFQEYVFMHQSQLVALPMQIALVAIIIILLYVRVAHIRKFNTYFFRMAPALLVAVLFSLPIFRFNSVQEDRINCQSNLKEYYTLLKKYAFDHDGQLPMTLRELSIPESSILSFCDPDHYEFHAAGQKLNTLAQDKLLSDNSGQHAGNYRLMLMSDGSFYKSLYGNNFKKTDDSSSEIAVDTSAGTKAAKAGKYE